MTQRTLNVEGPSFASPWLLIYRVTRLFVFFSVWTPAQSTAVFAKLDSTIDVLHSCIAREQEHRHLLELSSQQRATQAAVQKSSGDRSGSQPKLFFNIKHLRMLSAQNQMLEQHLSQQQSGDENALQPPTTERSEASNGDA